MFEAWLRNLPLLPYFKQASVSEKPLKENSFDYRTDGPWPLGINSGVSEVENTGNIWNYECGLVGTYVHRFIGLKLGCRGIKTQETSLCQERRRLET
jgi:hypothetical protein